MTELVTGALGLGDCLNCEANVMLKVNVNSKVYYKCTGDHDRKACGMFATFGATDSQNLIKAMKVKSDGNQSTEDAPEHEIKTASETAAGSGDAAKPRSVGRKYINPLDGINS